MSSTLAKRVALITGASSGIGLAITERLVSLGARAVINARRADRLESIANRLNRGAPTNSTRVLAVAGDAAETRTIQAMFDSAESTAGFGAPPNLIVVNAGRGLSGSVTTSDPAQWEEMIRTNLLGAARLMRESAGRLAAQGPAPDGEQGMTGAWLDTPRDLVLLGSSVGRNISPFSSMYGGTKFALHSLGEALRRELGPKGIRVSLIEPAIVESEFQAVAGYDPTNFGTFMRKIGPVLQPIDIARTVEFIVSQPAHIHIADVLIRPTRQDFP